MSQVNDKRNHRILLIDANRAIHNDFRKVLCDASALHDVAEDEAALCAREPSEESVFELDSAYEGQEGLAKVLQASGNGRPYAVTFIEMPSGGDALETITRLWQADSQLEIVVCSSFSDHSWSDLTQRLDCPSQLLILKKPVDSIELAQWARCLVDKWTLARQAESRIDEFAHSLTERKSTIEQARQETEALLAAISSLLIGVDSEGLVQRWNESAERVFGFTAEQAKGKRINELPIEWVNHDAADRFFRDHQLRHNTRRVLAMRCDGVTRILGVSSYPILEDGIYRGGIVLGTDITEQCQLEQQLQQAQKLEAVGQLAAGVAHEINTPMQYVGDNLEFLHNKVQKLAPLLDCLSEYPSTVECSSSDEESLAELRAHLKKLNVRSFLPQVLEAIDDSQHGVQHVSRIVRAMKEFAHPGDEEKTPVNVNQALESTIAVSTNEWKYVAEIDTNFEPSVPLVPALAGELNQAFLNILVNAAHAIGDTNDGGTMGKGRISISTRNLGEHVEIAIADTGTGIPDDIKRRIFDPFFTTKEVGKGTGQGLSIAHSVVVEKHGGALRCETNDGGTTFFIELPIEANQSETEREREPAITFR